MRLSLSGANPLEWLALRAGVVPTPAAEAWGGMGMSGMLIAAVRTGLAARLAQGPATAAALAGPRLGAVRGPVRGQHRRLLDLVGEPGRGDPQRAAGRAPRRATG